MGKPTATAAWQLQRLQQSGAVYENAIKELSKLTGQSEAVLRETFRQAGVTSMRFDDKVYKAAGLDPIPLHMSPAMTQVLSAGLAKTQGVIDNLTLTTAQSAQQAFIHAADIAYLQVSTGTFSYDEAIKRAIKEAAANGLQIFYPSGHTDHLDVAMRRAVLTGVSQTSGVLQTTRMDELGIDLVQTSAHIGARPSHQDWQGKVFSRSGTDRFYPDFISSTGYGTGDGLLGWNCRHSFYPYFKGISRPLYTEIETQDYKKKTVPYNGQDVPIYEATQQQRQIERNIRHWKRQAKALEAGGIPNTAELSKVKEWQAKMRDFVKQTGLQRQNIREQVFTGGPIKRINPPKPTTPKPAPKPKTPKPKPAPKPELKPTELRGKDIRQKMLDVDTTVQENYLKALDKKVDDLYKQMDQIPTRNDEFYTLYDKAKDLRVEVEAARADIINARRRALFVDDPNQVEIKQTTRLKVPKARQREGIDFYRNVISNKLEMEPVTVKLSQRQRAYYSPTERAAVVHKGSGTASTVHELGHHLEHSNKDILAKSIAFLERRTQGETRQSLRQLFGYGYGSDEYAKPDKFMSAYMGKVYIRGGQIDATEIVSMGLEYLYTDPVNFAKTDPDYFDFIIELIRGIN